MTAHNAAVTIPGGHRPPLQEIVMRNSILLVILVASLGVSGSPAARPAAQAGISGTASLSGTVESTTPFKAAQVFIRNVDKRILYMVYTNAGQFRAVALFPGNYEINVAAKGLESGVQKLVVKPGDNPKVKLSLHSTAGASSRTIINALET